MEAGLQEYPGTSLPAIAACGTRGLELQYREQQQEGQEDGPVRRITFTAASSAPLVRETFVGFIREKLEFRGLDDARLVSKTMPLLDSHNSRELRAVIGRIVDHSVVKRDSIDVLEVTAEFNLEVAASRAAYDKVRTGLVRNVSIGYAPIGPGGVRYEWHDRKADFDCDKDVVGDVTFARWEVTECSLVPVPADNKVGLGRDFQCELARAHARMHLTPGSNAMTEQAQNIEQEKEAAVAAAPVEQERALAAPQEAVREVVKEVVKEVPAKHDGTGLRYLAKSHAQLRKQGITEEQHQELVDAASDEGGMSESAVKQRLWELMESRDTQAVASIGQGQAPAIHTGGGRATHRNFDLGRLVKCLASRGGLDGREGEVVQDYTDSIPQLGRPELGGNLASAVIPWRAFAENDTCRKLITSFHNDAAKRSFYMEAESRAFEVGTGTPSGHFTEVFDESWFVEALVANAMTLQHLTRLSSEMTQNRIGVTESGTLSTYHSTTETATRVESTGLSFGNRKMKWHQINSRFDVSRRTLDQSNYFMPEVMRVQMRDLFRGVNIVALRGSGNSGVPRGIKNFASIDNVAIGTNGGQPDYGHMVDMRKTIEANNANIGMGKYVITPEIKARLQQTARFTGSTGSASDRIIHSPAPGMNSLDGYEVITENNLAKDGSKGTGTGLHTMIFADLSDCEWGTFSGVELLIDPYSASINNQLRVFLRLAYDISPRHVDSFVITTDAQT